MQKISLVFLVILLMLLSFSCQKEKVYGVYPAMRGYWKHYTSEEAYRYLSIGGDSRGNIEYFNDPGDRHDTKERGWFIKKNKLVFGRLSGGDEVFIIDSLPKISTRYFISGYDTVNVSDAYMILDGGVYVDHK